MSSDGNYSDAPHNLDLAPQEELYTDVSLTDDQSGSSHSGSAKGGVVLDTVSLGTLPLLKTSYDMLICYIQCYSAMGITLNLVGPMLKLLEKQVHVNSTSQMALFFVARAIGFLVGTLLGGQVADRLGRYKSSICMVLGIFMSALITCVYPFASSLWQLMLIGFTSSIFMGFIDNVVQILLLALYKEKSSPFLQALHMGFALGATLAPLFIAAFLQDGEEDTSVDDYQYAFYSMAMYIALCGAYFLMLVYKNRFPAEEKKEEASGMATKSHVTNLNGFSGNGYLLIGICAVILFLYVGSETGYGNQLATYAKNRGFLNDKRAALLTSVFWCCFLLGRISGVALSLYFAARTLIYADLWIAIAGLALQQIAINSSVVIWISTAILGFGYGSFYAAVIIWLSGLLEMTGKVMSVLVTMVSLGEATFPLFMALLMDDATVVFITINLVVVLFCLILYFLADRYQAKRKNTTLTDENLPGIDLDDI